MFPSKIVIFHTYVDVYHKGSSMNIPVLSTIELLKTIVNQIPFDMVISHNYVDLPEGTNKRTIG